MKKIFPYILILVVLVGILGPTTNVDAQAPSLPACIIQYFGSATPVITNAPCIDANGVTHQVATPAAGAAAKASIDGGGGCWVWDIPCYIRKALEAIFYAILTLMSFILWLAGQLLNYVLDYTIMDMKKNLDDLDGINIAWKVIKDLMNIAFIFMLVYEGIKLIIGVGSREYIKKFIAGIVLASILINFSLFFTKVLIDASNIVTIGIYTQILGPNANVKDTWGFPYGLSNPIVKSLGLTSIYDSDAPAFGSGKDIAGIFIMGFGSGTVILIASFIFFAVAIIFLVRYLVLIFLLMLSPIGYMGMGLPFMKPYATKWWESFKGQLLFGPIYMLMTWVILTLMGSKGFITAGSYSEMFNGASKINLSSMSLLFNFVLLIGLLIASLVIAKNTAKQGSELIGQATGKVSAFAGGVVAGGASGIMRNTVGARYDRMANDQQLMDAAARGDKGAQARLDRYRKLASSSFDARRSKLGESLQSSTGMGLGKGTEGVPFMGNAKAGEGGFEKKRKDEVKKREEYIKSLKPTDEQEEAHKLQAKERALKTLADKERMAEIEKLDKVARDKYFREHPEEEKVFADTKEQLLKAEDKAKKEVEAARTAIESKKTVVDSKIRDLARALELAKAGETIMKGSSDERVYAEKRVEAERALNEQTEKKKNLDKELETENKELDKKVEAHKTAQKAITDNEKIEADKRMAIKSKEHNELLLDSQEKGQTLYQYRGNAYAEKLQEKAIRVENTATYNPARLWRGNARTHIAAASAVRKTIKGKSTDEQLADLAKKMLKERKERGLVDEDETTPETPTPAPTPPPAPPTTNP